MDPRRFLAIGAGLLCAGARAGPSTPRPFIANGWPAHASILLMLGAGPRIAATVNRSGERPWMYLVQPSLHGAVQAAVGGFVVEELLRRRVGLAFVSQADRTAAQMAAAGITVVQTRFQDIATMRDCVIQTASALGGEAPARALAYLTHLDREVASLQRWSAALPEPARPRVLHLAQLQPVLLADGAGTIVDTWIRSAGGRNAAATLQGNLRPVSLEQVSLWDPDVIMLAAHAARQTPPPGYQALRAVRTGRVRVNPDGVFLWDRYGCEITLQMRWAAAQLHPQRAPADDLVARTCAFYREFFGYPLTAAQARKVIAGAPP